MTDRDQEFEFLIGAVHEEILESTDWGWAKPDGEHTTVQRYDAERIMNVLHVTDLQSGRKFEIEFRSVPCPNSTS